MKLFSLFILTVFFQATPTPRQITVTLTDADGRPVAGQVINLTVHIPLIRQSCTTDANGYCEFNFSAAGDLLRGDLVLVGRGRRSLLWKGAQFDLPLQLSEAGTLDVPYDYALPTEAPVVPQATETGITATETAAAPTATETTAVTPEATAGPTETPPATIIIPLQSKQTPTAPGPHGGLTVPISTAAPSTSVPCVDNSSPSAPLPSGISKPWMSST